VSRSIEHVDDMTAYPPCRPSYRDLSAFLHDLLSFHVPVLVTPAGFRSSLLQ
jgi:hypothetical protein